MKVGELKDKLDQFCPDFEIRLDLRLRVDDGGPVETLDLVVEAYPDEQVIHTFEEYRP